MSKMKMELQINPIQSNRSTRSAVAHSQQPIQALSRNGVAIQFYEYYMPMDGDCGYHSLGVPRAVAARQLLEHSGDSDIRAMLAPEIEDQLLADHFPTPLLEDDAIEVLLSKHQQYVNAQQTLQALTLHLKLNYDQKRRAEFAALTTDRLLLRLAGEAKTSLQQRINTVRQLRDEIRQCSREKNIFEAYVRHYIAVRNCWLSFSGGDDSTYSSLDAIAKLNRLSVTVWGMVDDTNVLKVLHCYNSNPADRVLNLFFSDNHFNQLHDQPGLSIYPVSTDANAEDPIPKLADKNKDGKNKDDRNKELIEKIKSDKKPVPVEKKPSISMPKKSCVPVLPPEIEQKIWLELKVESESKEVKELGLLHLAVKQEKLETIKTLIAYGFDVNSYNLYQRQPIEYADNHDSKEIKEFLNQEIARVNTGVYAVIEAAKKGSSIEEVLNKYNITVHHKNKLGDSPLYTLTLLKEINGVKNLLAFGCDVEQENSQSLYRAIEMVIHLKDHALLLAFIHAGSELDKPNYSGYTVLQMAANSGFTAGALSLMEAGADIEAQTPDSDRTALHMAIQNGNFNLVQGLLERNANLEIVDKFGFSALHYAIRYGRKEIVKYLIEKGADIHKPTLGLGTALHIAVCSGHFDIALILLENGAILEDSRCEDILEPLLGVRPLKKSADNLSKESKEKKETKEADNPKNKKSEKTKEDKKTKEEKTSKEEKEAKEKSEQKKAKVEVPETRKLLERKTHPLSKAYKLLGVPKNVRASELKKRFHQLSLKQHPDKGGDKEKYKDLMTARDLVTQDLEKNGKNQSFKFENKYNPLSCAIVLGHVDMVEYFLKQGSSLFAALKKLQGRPLKSQQYAILYKNYQALDLVLAQLFFKKIDPKINTYLIKLLTLDKVIINNNIVDFKSLAEKLINGHYTFEEIENGLIQAAAKRGDLPLVKLLVQSGINSFERDRNNKTAMDYCLNKKNRSEILKYLRLEANRVKATVEKLVLALDKANDLETSLKEVQMGLHYTTSQGLNLLMVAFQKKCFKTVKALVEAGVNIEQKDGNGRSALHWMSITCEDKETIEFITNRYLSKKCDVNLKDNHGKTALQYAVANRNIQAAKALVHLSVVGLDAFHVAIKQNDIACLALLVSSQEKDFLKKSNGMELLHLAVLMQKLEIVKWLFNAGVLFDKNNPLSKEILYCTLLQDNYKMARNLFAHGASLDILSETEIPESSKEKIELMNPDCIGYSYSQWKELRSAFSASEYSGAVYNFFLRLLEDNVCKESVPDFPYSCIQQLKRYHFNEKEFSEKGVLQSLAERGAINLIKKIVKLGADVNQQNRVGKRAIDYARSYEYLPLVEYLESEQKQNVERANTLLDAAVLFNSSDRVENAISAGARILELDPYTGMQAIHSAAYHNKIESLKTLLKHGVSIEALTRNFETPLCLAALKGHLEVVRLLCEMGASIDHVSHQGSPLALAAKHRHAFVFEYLYAKGAHLELVPKSFPQVIQIAEMLVRIHQETIQWPAIYQKSLQQLLRQGFALQFKSGSSSKPKAELNIKVERLFGPGTLFIITIHQYIAQFNCTVMMTKNYNTDILGDLSLSLPGLESATILIDQKGGLQLKNFDYNQNCIIHTIGDCYLENVKTSQRIVIQKSSRVSVKGEVVANEGILCNSDNLKNRGRVLGKNITLFLRSSQVKYCSLDNQWGVMLAREQLKIHTKDILNYKGVLEAGTLMIRSVRANNSEGIMFSELETQLKIHENLNNQHGVIGAKKHNVFIESLMGKIKTTQLGQIQSEQGQVRIETLRIEVDSTSVLKGHLGVDVSGQILMMDSPIVSAEIKLNAEDLLLVNGGAIAAQKMELEQKMGLLLLKKPLKSAQSIKITAPLIHHYSLITSNGPIILRSTSQSPMFTIINNGQLISRQEDIYFYGHGLRHTSCASVVAKRSIYPQTHHLDLQGSMSAGQDIHLRETGGHFEWHKKQIVAQGELALYWLQGRSINEPVTVSGSLSYTLAPTATIPLTFLACHTIHKEFKISTSTPVFIGQNGGQYITLQAGTGVSIQASLIDIVYGRVGSGQSLFFTSSGLMELGRLPSPGQIPSGLYSEADMHLKAAAEIHWNSLDGYCGRHFQLECTNLDDISSDVLIQGNARFRTASTRHRLLVSKSLGGPRVNWGWDGAHQAFKCMGASEHAASSPAKLIVVGELESSGVMEIFASQVNTRKFQGTMPTLTALVPYQHWYEHSLCGHRKVEKAKWEVNEGYSQGTPMPALLNSCQALVAYTKKLNIGGVVLANTIQITEIQEGQIGLSISTGNRQWCIRLPAPNPFRMRLPLAENYTCPSAFYEIKEAEGSAVFQSVFFFAAPKTTSKTVIETPEGCLIPNTKNLRHLFTPLQESHLLIKTVISNLGRGCLDESATSSEHMLAILQQNTQQFMADSTSARKSLSDITKPMMVYQEVEFLHASGKTEWVLVPVLRVPSSMNNLKLRDWAGGLFARDRLLLQGESRNGAHLSITGHLEATEGKITISSFNMIRHERRTTTTVRTVVDKTIHKRPFHKKVKETHRIVSEVHLEPGATIAAEELEYNNIETVVMKGLQAHLGKGGLKTQDIKNIQEDAIIEQNIEQSTGSTKTRLHKIQATRHLNTHVIHPTVIHSVGPIQLAADYQYLNSLQARSEENKVQVEANHQLVLGSTVVQDDLSPQYDGSRSISSVKTGTQEKGITVGIIADKDNVIVQSNGTLLGKAPQIFAGQEAIISGNTHCQIDALKLNSHYQTSTKGFSGLKHVKQTQTENRQSGLVMHCIAGTGIHISSRVGDVVLEAPALKSEVVIIRAPQGTLSLKPAIFKNDLTNEQLSQGLSFFGSAAVEAVMKRDYKAAAKGLLQSFPLLASVGELLKSRDTADTVSHGMKSLYQAYQTYKSFAEANNLGDFLKNQISVNPNIRFGKEKCAQVWTEVALPWIQARELLMLAQNIHTTGLQAEYESFCAAGAQQLTIDAAARTLKSEQQGKGASLGLSLEMMLPSFGLDRSRESGMQHHHIHSHLKGKNTTLMAGDTISLKGVYVETLKAIVEAENLRMETLQDTQHSHNQSQNASSMGSFGASLGHSDARWSSEQTILRAEELLRVNIKKKMKLTGAKLELGASGTGSIDCPVIEHEDVISEKRETQTGLSLDFSSFVGQVITQTKSSVKGVGQFDHKNKKSAKIDKATIGSHIAVNTASDISGLNRDASQSSVTTHTKSHWGMFAPLGNWNEMAKEASEVLQRTPKMFQGSEQKVAVERKFVMEQTGATGNRQKAMLHQYKASKNKTTKKADTALPQRNSAAILLPQADKERDTRTKGPRYSKQESLLPKVILGCLGIGSAHADELDDHIQNMEFNPKKFDPKMYQRLKMTNQLKANKSSKNARQEVNTSAPRDLMERRDILLEQRYGKYYVPESTQSIRELGQNIAFALKIPRIIKAGWDRLVDLAILSSASTTLLCPPEYADSSVYETTAYRSALAREQERAANLIKTIIHPINAKEEISQDYDFRMKRVYEHYEKGENLRGGMEGGDLLADIGLMSYGLGSLAKLGFLGTAKTVQGITYSYNASVKARLSLVTWDKLKDSVLNFGSIPEVVNFRAVNPNYPANQLVLKEMSAKKFLRSATTEPIDSSIIAHKLYDVAGNKGEYLFMTPAWRQHEVMIPTRKNKQLINESRTYYQVYSDGRYVYDPLLSLKPIPRGDYQKFIRSNNSEWVDIYRAGGNSNRVEYWEGFKDKTYTKYVKPEPKPERPILNEEFFVEATTFRPVNSDYPANESILKKYACDEFLEQVKNPLLDCSRLAEILYETTGNEGMIISITPLKGLHDIYIPIRRFGKLDVIPYGYHEIYSDGCYIYDARLSLKPIPRGDYQKIVKKNNPDGFETKIVTDESMDSGQKVKL